MGFSPCKITAAKSSNSFCKMRRNENQVLLGNPPNVQCDNCHNILIAVPWCLVQFICQNLIEQFCWQQCSESESNWQRPGQGQLANLKLTIQLGTVNLPVFPVRALILQLQASTPAQVLCNTKYQIYVFSILLHAAECIICYILQNTKL